MAMRRFTTHEILIFVFTFSWHLPAGISGEGREWGLSALQGGATYLLK